MISSRELAEFSGIHPAQVRKDLAYFGQFGQRGVGYAVSDLKRRMRTILGLDREWRVAIIGAGRLGTALMMYQGFSQSSFKVVAAFDVDADKIGWEIEGVRIQEISELPQAVRQQKIEIAILCVPAAVAQAVAELAVAAQIAAILNFAPVNLQLPKGVELRNVDVSSELEALTFFLKS